jgi:type IV pilus assembly protein PilW
MREECTEGGFGLVEMMVGLAIGMIATLVIAQVASTFEGQKRSTTGAADAQTTGGIALYTIQRQVQMGGYGLPVYSQQNQALDCATEPKVDHDGNAGTPDIGIAPVVIVDGGAGLSDAITVRMGSTAAGGVPLRVTSPLGTNPVRVPNNLSCTPLGAGGLDVALITDGANCALRKIAALPSSTEIQLDDVSDAAIHSGSTLACLGQWRETSYTINGNRLLENGVEIAGDIVNLQARYGVSNAANSSQVLPDSYVDATDPTWGAAMTAANRNRIKSIRIALVVRSGAMEKDDVTSACSSLTDPNPTGLCAWAGTSTNPAPSIDLSADANWKKYRYRVFDTVIPVRNMIWSAGAL